MKRSSPFLVVLYHKTKDSRLFGARDPAQGIVSTTASTCSDSVSLDSADFLCFPAKQWANKARCLSAGQFVAPEKTEVLCHKHMSL